MRVTPWSRFRARRRSATVPVGAGSRLRVARQENAPLLGFAADLAKGSLYGAVAYDYKIGKYEANRRMEVLRWTVRMAKDRKLFTRAQFEFSARALNECGRVAQEPWRRISSAKRSLDRRHSLRQIAPMIFSAVITEAEEGGYVAFNPDTGTTTQGETFDEAVANLREATELYLEEFPMKGTRPAVLTCFEVSHAQAAGC